MNHISFTVPGVPVPKGRPKFGKGNVYTPKKTQDYEEKVKAFALIARQKAKQKVWTGPICVELVFHVKGSWTSKPDLDNLIKSCLDGCKGVIFKDDSQIVDISARKVAGYDELKAVFNFFQIDTPSRT